MSKRLLPGSIGVVFSVALLAAGCGPGETSGSGGGTGGATVTSSGGTAGTGGASTGGTAGSGGTTTGTPAFGDWHAGWIVSWPTTGGDDAIGKLGPGGATVAGTFQGTITFPGKEATAPVGGHDSYVVRIDPTGQIAWSTIFEDTESVWITGVDVDANGRVIAAGRFTGDLTIGAQTMSSVAGIQGFVALLGSDGAPLWARAIGPTSGSTDVWSAGFFPDGAVWIAGEHNQAFDIDGVTIPAAGSGDLYVAKLAAADGKLVWSRGLGGTDVEFLFNAASDPAGDLLLSGVYAGDLDFGTGTLPPGPADGYGFLAKLSGADGTATFAREVGAALGYVTGAPDGFYFAGTLNGTADFGGGELSTSNDLPVVAAYGPTGDFRWTGMYGDAETVAPAAALPDASTGGLAAAWAVSGAFDFGEGPVSILGGEDVFLGAFPADESSPRIHHLGGAGVQSPHSVSLGKDGGALVVGHFNGTFSPGPVDSGDASVTSQGVTDAFVLFLAPN